MLSSRRLLKSLLSLLPKLLCLLLFSCCTQFAHAQYYIFRQDTTINAGDPTYENLDLVVDNCTVTINGLHFFDSLTVQHNGVVTHSANSSAPADINVIYDVVVFPGSRIDVSGKGYPARTGPSIGGGSVGDLRTGGGGYGGEGGTGEYFGGGSGGYGSIRLPVDYGSGGGGSNGGAGGGAIRLTVTGAVTVNGGIYANGAKGGSDQQGGGSGGSILIVCNTFGGSGTVAANGGPRSDSGDRGGSGGGGRIALYYTGSTFTGAIQSGGEYGYSRGGAGTIFTKTPSQINGDLKVANLGGGYWTPMSGTNTFDNVLITASGVLTHPPYGTGGIGNPDGTQSGFHLIVTGNCQIDANSYLYVDGRG